MGEDNQTKEHLLESARSEFMEKGYMKASLRKICANAGVTTGALYFFFKDKEDLFGAIVEKPLTELIGFMTEHFDEDEHLFSLPQPYVHIDGDHDEISDMLIHHLYANYDAFILLLTKSQGSRYEGCVDRIVDMTERSYVTMADIMASKYPGKRVDQYFNHWFTHMTIDAFIHLLTHEPDEFKAVKHMQRIMNYIIRGWMEMILIPDDEQQN